MASLDNICIQKNALADVLWVCCEADVDTLIQRNFNQMHEPYYPSDL